jgi:hypothetical protein
MCDALVRHKWTGSLYVSNCPLIFNVKFSELSTTLINDKKSFERVIKTKQLTLFSEKKILNSDNHTKHLLLEKIKILMLSCRW